MWNTFYGAKMPIESLSHQHLSNILWYYEIVIKNPLRVQDVQDVITHKYGGLRLPYRPMISFTQEITYLFIHGHISSKINSDIIVSGRWVGKLNYN